MAVFDHKLLGWAWLPLIAAVAWLTTLIALLGHQAQDKKRDPSLHGFRYISNVGAIHKGGFIAGAVITSVLFIASLITEAVLRFKYQLRPILRKIQVVFSMLAILFASTACSMLLSLTIRDVESHKIIHWRFTIFFIAFVLLSAASTSAEYILLKRSHPRSHLLTVSFSLKIALIVVSVIAVILFYQLKDLASRIMEWSIAFIFDIYLWTLVFDLRPSVKRHKFVKVVTEEGKEIYERQTETVSPFVGRIIGAGEPENDVEDLINIEKEGANNLKSMENAQKAASQEVQAPAAA